MSANYEAMDERESFVPHHMRDGFKLWIEKGIEPGSFGMAILTNNLAEAFGRADHINKPNIGTIVSWFYNFAPSACWGSEENISSWPDKLRSGE